MRHAISRWRSVDATQHMARLEEAIATLLVPHTLRDLPAAPPLRRQRGAIAIRRMSRFAYPDGRSVFDGFDLRIEPERARRPGRRVRRRKVDALRLAAALPRSASRTHPDRRPRHRHTTQDSLRAAIAVVPQDVGLLNRSVIENIRYGRPDIPRKRGHRRGRGGALHRVHRDCCRRASPRSSAIAA